MGVSVFEGVAAPGGISSDTVSVDGLTGGVDAIFLPQPLSFLPLREDLRLDFGTGSATFTRSTIKTFDDRDDGLVKTAAIDVAAFEQNGILIEGSSTNRLVRSEEFGNAIWLKGNGASVVSSDTQVAPDGTTTADVVDLSAGSTAKIEQIAVGVISATHTFTIYAKVASGTDTFRLNFNDSVAGNQTSSNLTVTTAFQRFEFTATFGAGGSRNIDIRANSGGTTGEIIIWGADLEQLPFASSYIKTIASTVTRTADNLSIDAVNIPTPAADFSISSDVCLIGEDISVSQRQFNVAGETKRSLQISTAGGNASLLRLNSTGSNPIGAGPAVNTVTKYASVRAGAVQTLFEGSLSFAGTVTADATGTKTSIEIGRNGSAEYLFGHIKDFRIYDVALTADQVGTL